MPPALKEVFGGITQLEHINAIRHIPFRALVKLLREGSYFAAPTASEPEEG